MMVMDAKQKVRTLYRAGQWHEAKQLCLTLCEASPADVEAWFLLGAIHGQLGAFEEAERCCQRVVAQWSHVPIAHFNLGIALQNQGKFEEAILCFRQACALNPHMAEAHNELGVTLQLGQGNLKHAVESYRQALALRPEYVEAHHNLGTVLRDLAQHDDALRHFREAIRLRPAMVKARSVLGLLLCELGKSEEAVACCREGLCYEPDNPELLISLGVIMQKNGQFERALEVFRRVLEISPEHKDAIGGLAQVLERMGRFEEGYVLLQPFLKEEKVNSSVALAYASLAAHLDRRSEAMALLERALAGGDAAECKTMHFALGKLHDEIGQYDAAFTHFQRANALERGNFDIKLFGQRLDALELVFSAGSIARRQRASNESELPVFIVGMPRSGTSLVEQILSSHPEVYGAGELNDLATLEGSLPGILGTGTPYPYCVDMAKRKQLNEIAMRHLYKLSGLAPGARRVTDKMPHNFQQLGLIDMLFPRARVIHCMRDPIDTCLSIYSLPFNTAHLYASSLTDLGAYYWQYWRLMGHWRQTLRIPMLEVRYEDLVANQEEVTRRMIEFCGLKWDDRCLRFHESDRAVATPSYDQVRRPLYRKSVGRWKNYEHHLGPLINALKAINYAKPTSGVSERDDSAQ